MSKHEQAARLPLGKPTPVPREYAPEVLVAFPRAAAREVLGLDPGGVPDMEGRDTWVTDELSWLDGSGKPVLARGELRFPADSELLIESKSLKLYLVSLNQMRFASTAALAARVTEDLSACAQAPVHVVVLNPPVRSEPQLDSEECIDGEPLGDEPTYTLAPELLRPFATTSASDGHRRTLHSRLFRSLCPVTAQPDWATVRVTTEGAVLAPASLLRYLVSYRETQAFHEVCIERILHDVVQAVHPAFVEVEGRFAPRGGIAIHPMRRWRARA